MDPLVQHWCEYIQRICLGSSEIEQAQTMTPHIAEVYERFSIDAHKVKTFLDHLSSLVQAKVDSLPSEEQANG